MDEQKLNEKLAEWAGIPLHAAIDFGLPYNLNVYEPPNFAQSLDACFKWLMPKFNWWMINKSVIGFTYAEVRIYPEIGIDYKSGIYAGYDAPALALCLAIFKLIDMERNE